METWGDKPKSQVDNSLIDDAIAAAIAAHKADPDAHLEVGESLQSHKASEVIDHLARSIVSDKLEDWIEINAIGNMSRDDFHWFTIFESLDGFSVNGSVSAYSNGVYFETTADNDNSCSLAKIVDYFFIPLTWSKNRRIRTMLFLDWITSQEIWLFTGTDIGAAEHIGFKILNGTLYGTVGNGDNESALNCGSISSDNHSFEVIFTAGVSCEFIVDGVSKGTITTNLPTGEAGAGNLCTIYIQTKTTAIRYMTVFGWDLWQAS
jgi:hypothetical protein